MYTYDGVYEFLVEELRVKREQLTPDVSLRDDLGIEGDDFVEFEEAFARRFNVVGCLSNLPTLELTEFRSHPHCFWKVRMRVDGHWNILRTNYRLCVSTGSSMWASSSLWA